MKKTFKSFKGIVVLTLVLALVISVFAGCGNKKGTAVGFDVSESKYDSTYPIKGAEDVTLTYWRATTAAVQKSAPNNYGDLPFSKELEKKTGVKIDYVHPSLTNAAEKFTLLISSGKLTDIIGYNMNSYTGGAQQAVDDGVIHQLNIEGNNILEAWAPDYNALLNQHSDTVLKEAMTDKGYIYAFGTIAPDQELNTTAGPIVRGDWLEELHADGTLPFEKPTTVDEWYTMLKAFKDKKGATAPLSAGGQGFYCGFISGAYGTNLSWYRDGNTVKYAPMEDGYKDYLTTMNKWYKEGLYDSGFDTKDANTVTAQLLDGRSGATWNAIGGGIGTLMSNVEAKTADDPQKNAKFIGVQYPTLDGSKSEFAQASAKFNPVTSISTQCKDPELAAKWLNYGYTKEGHLLYNFGIENKTYKWVEIEHRKTDDYGGYIKDEKTGEYIMETSKYPQYTDEVKKNPTLTMQEAFAKYSQAGGAGGGGMYRQDPRYLEQYAVREEQKDAWTVWCDTNAFDHYVPNTSVAEKDQKEYSITLTSIDDYVNQEYIKFIKGTRPLSEFDDFRKTLEGMGVKKIIEIKQAAYDAYLARK